MTIDIKAIGATCAGVAVFIAVRAIMSPHEPKPEEVSHAVSEALVDLQAKAKVHADAGSKSDTMAAVASEAAAQQMAKASPAKRRVLAAGQFTGYYYVNTVVLTDVCRAEGVDISNYVTEFRNEHSAEHARAVSLLQAAGATEDLLTAALAANHVGTEGIIQQTMRDVATQMGKSSVKDGCTIFADHAIAIAHARKVSTTSPELWKAFMSPG